MQTVNTDESQENFAEVHAQPEHEYVIWYLVTSVGA